MGVYKYSIMPISSNDKGYPKKPWKVDIMNSKHTFPRMRMVEFSDYTYWYETLWEGLAAFLFKVAGAPT